MQRRTTFLLLALVAVLALPVGLFLLSADSNREQRTLLPEPGPASTTEARALTSEALAAANAQTSAPAIATDEAQRQAVSPTIPAGRQQAPISGLLHDERQLGLAEETVLAFEVAGSPTRAPIAETQTGDDGEFAFPQLDREVLVVVQPDGFLPRWIRVQPYSFASIKVFDSYPLHGVVLSEASRKPLANVELRSKTRSFDGGELRQVQVVRTDDDGRFELPHARVGTPLKVTLHWRDWVPALRTIPIQADDDEVTLLLGESRPVLIRTVALETSVPLANVRVRVGGGFAGESDENGRLDFVEDHDGANAEREVTAQLEHGVLSKVVWSADVRRAGVLLEIPVLAGASVRGIVLDEQQQPIEGARVSMAGSRKQSQMAPHKGFQLVDGERNVTTDALGVFHLRGVVPRSRAVSVVVRHKGYEQAVSEAIKLGSDGAEATVRVVLRRGAQIHGTITLGGAELSTRVRWKAQRSAGSTTSNDFGEYELTGLPSGPVTLLVEHPDRRGKNDRYIATLELELAPGESRVVDVHAARDTGLISGLVTLLDGTPLGGKRVMASSETERGQRVSIRGETDPSGEFELEVPLDLGVTYRVTADLGPVRVTKRGVVPGTTDLHLTFEEQGALWLSIADLYTGSPIDGASVRWRTSNSPEARWLGYSNRGNPLLHGAGERIALALPLGRVDLIVGSRAAGYTPVEVANQEVLREPRSVHSVLLEPGTKLELLFVDQQGEPLKRGSRARRSKWALELSGSPDSSAAQLPRWARRIDFKVPVASRVTLKGVPPGSVRFLLPRQLAKQVKPRRFTVTPTGTQQLTVRIGR